MDEKARVVDGYGRKDITIQNTKVYRSEAILAQEIAIKWALVAGMPDGEDSAGRQRFRLATPDELVTRAFDIAERFRSEAKVRGLILDLPDLPDLDKDSE